MDIANYLDRITELQQVAITNANAEPVGIYSQSDFPYWTNHLSAVNVTTGMGLGFVRYEVTIIMTLHRGKVLSGEKTQLERQCQADVFTVLNAFFATNARHLITDTYTTVQDGYQPNSHRITSDGVVLIGISDSTSVLGSQYTLQFAHIDT